MLFYLLQAIVYHINEQLRNGYSIDDIEQHRLSTLHIHSLPCNASSAKANARFQEVSVSVVYERYLEHWYHDTAGRLGITPSSEHFAALDEFYANPRQSSSSSWNLNRSLTMDDYSKSQRNNDTTLWRCEDLLHLLSGCGNVSMLREQARALLASNASAALVAGKLHDVRYSALCDMNLERLLHQAGTMLFVGSLLDLPEWLTQLDKSTSLAAPDVREAATVSTATLTWEIIGMPLMQLPYELLERIIMLCPSEWFAISCTCSSLQRIVLNILRTAAALQPQSAPRQEAAPKPEATSVLSLALWLDDSESDSECGSQLEPELEASLTDSQAFIAKQRLSLGPLVAARIERRWNSKPLPQSVSVVATFALPKADLWNRPRPLTTSHGERLTLLHVYRDLGWGLAVNAVGAAGCVPLSSIELAAA